MTTTAGVIVFSVDGNGNALTHTHTPSRKLYEYKMASLNREIIVTSENLRLALKVSGKEHQGAFLNIL